MIIRVTDYLTQLEQILKKQHRMVITDIPKAIEIIKEASETINAGARRTKTKLVIERLQSSVVPDPRVCFTVVEYLVMYLVM
jgi:hypothetical protein